MFLKGLIFVKILGSLGTNFSGFGDGVFLISGFGAGITLSFGTGTIPALFAADGGEFCFDLRGVSSNFNPIELSQLTATRDLMEKFIPVIASPSFALREIMEFTPTI